MNYRLQVCIKSFVEDLGFLFMLVEPSY